MKIRRIHFLLVILGLAICAIPFREEVRRSLGVVEQKLLYGKTVEDRVDQFGDEARRRLAPDFERIGVSYPPSSIALVGIKQSKVLEVWVSDPPRLLKTYPILGASGGLGPKLRQGDWQVPEGLYRIESLHPNSAYHLALRVDYPNGFDQMKGRLDGRESLGSDIMIHGKSSSVGCLAMGDEAIEELFVLVAESWIYSIPLILTPVDFRKEVLPAEMPDVPYWTPELYDMISEELKKLVGGGGRR